MPKVAEKLTQMGLVLPAELQPPAGLVLPFAWVNVRGATVYVSGHGPQNEDGSIAGPFGQVGGEVSLNDAVDLARKAAISMLARRHGNRSFDGSSRLLRRSNPHKE